MKLLLVLLCAASLYAFDFSSAIKSVDKEKAVDSVKVDEVKKAYDKGADVTAEDIQKSVDMEKAKDSIDTEKLTKSLFD